MFGVFINPLYFQRLFCLGKYWCSTKTDSNGNHINNQGHYGFCGFCEQPACGCGCSNEYPTAAINPRIVKRNAPNPIGAASNSSEAASTPVPNGGNPPN